MTPESLKVLFDANWIAIAFVIGLLVKYVPALKGVSNKAIPWFNVIVYIVGQIGGQIIGVQDAHAAGFDFGGTVPSLVGVVIGGFTNAVWARQLYEGFGRALLERWLTKPR